MVRPGYKQTEVGEIPEDWDSTKLGYLANIQRGASPRPINSPVWFDDNSSVGWLRISDVSKAKKYLYETTQFLSQKGIENSRYVEQDNLVMSICATVGRPILTRLNVCIHDGFVVFKTITVSKEYLYYVLSDIERNWSKHGQTGSQMNLNTGLINSTSIPLPPIIEEQKAIAKALSDVDELIVSLEKMIAKKRDIKTATMQQFLTGKKRLSGFGGEWSLIQIENNANLKARIGWQALTTKEYLNSGAYYLVTGTDFAGGRVNWSTCHFVDEWRYDQDRNIQLKKGDVLLTKDGTIGKVGYVDYLELPATLNSGVFVIRPINNKFDPLFLYYVLSSRIFDEFIAKITAGSTITHLYQKDFVNFEFLAPDITEQNEIALMLNAMDVELAHLTGKLDKTKSIKQGMMQELLTGRTRLVDVAQLSQVA
ncbi:restriction endonuclease subunit S [uncultured Nitrosomonas sp.]|uniref:restriction endonuclease subunit S n=1 Tax=uncultured Nitrosomonas sp. TaxID=156424 RepID=UPI0025E3E4E2|nr:restriction endonuclease subunit S [uncultured Nitrosomonas sp.]